MVKKIFLAINYRLFIVHFVAFWLFAYAFQTLAFLHDHEFFKESLNRVNMLNFPARYRSDVTFVQQSSIFGILVAYIISWSISTKRNWFWLSSALCFVAVFALRVYGLLLWDKFSIIFLKPGSVFSDYSIYGYILNAAIMIGLACFIFFHSKIISFIDKGESGAFNEKKNTVSGAANTQKARVMRK